jgi:hypothetical protein
MILIRIEAQSRDRASRELDEQDDAKAPAIGDNGRIQCRMAGLSEVPKRASLRWENISCSRSMCLAILNAKLSKPLVMVENSTAMRCDTRLFELLRYCIVRLRKPSTEVMRRGSQKEKRCG